MTANALLTKGQYSSHSIQNQEAWVRKISLCGPSPSSDPAGVVHPFAPERSHSAQDTFAGQYAVVRRIAIPKTGNHFTEGRRYAHDKAEGHA